MKTQPFGQLILFFLLALVLSFKVSGQEGHQLSITGGGQLTKISNQGDFNGRSRINSTIIEEIINPENTYNTAFQIRYTHNFQPHYGYQTGVAYIVAGQAYSGRVDDTSGNNVSFNSEVTLKYLRFPLKFRFNTSLNEDVQSVYLSIGAGFGIDVLTDVQLSNSATNIGGSQFQLDDQSIDYNDLYKDVTVSFMADALFNVKLSDKLWLVSGFNMSFGLSDIENKSFDFPDDAPNELYFPASTSKVNKPDLQSRQSARNTIFGIELGLKYRFGEGN